MVSPQNLKSAISIMRSYYLTTQIPANYDYIVDGFKPAYVDSLNVTYGFSDASYKQSQQSAPWIQAAHAYFDALSLLGAEKPAVPIVLNKISPRTASARSINIFIQEMTDLLEDGLRYYNIHESELYKEPVVNKVSTKSSGSPQKQYFIEYIFKNILDTNELDGNGYKYFDFEKTDGVPMISKDQYTNRSNEEINKFFTGVPNKSSIAKGKFTVGEKKEITKISNSAYTHFTPRKIKFDLQEKELNGNDETFDRKFFNEFALKKDFFKSARNLQKPSKDFFDRGSRSASSAESPPGYSRADKFNGPSTVTSDSDSRGPKRAKQLRFKSSKQLFESTSTKLGFKFGPSKKMPWKSMTDVKFKTGQEASSLEMDKSFKEANNYLGEISNFHKIEESNNVAASRDKKNIEFNLNFLSSVQSDVERDPNKKAPSLFKDFAKVPKDKLEIANLPISLKSLLMNGSISNKRNFNDIDPFRNSKTRNVMENMYTKIITMKYLEGYRKKGELNLLYNPIWKPIDGEYLKSFESGQIYCRVFPYVSDSYNISNNNPDFKNYNSIFILKGDRSG